MEKGGTLRGQFGAINKNPDSGDHASHLSSSSYSSSPSISSPSNSPFNSPAGHHHPNHHLVGGNGNSNNNNNNTSTPRLLLLCIIATTAIVISRAIKNITIGFEENFNPRMPSLLKEEEQKKIHVGEQQRVDLRLIVAIITIL